MNTTRKQSTNRRSSFVSLFVALVPVRENQTSSADETIIDADALLALRAPSSPVRRDNDEVSGLTILLILFYCVFYSSYK